MTSAVERGQTSGVISTGSIEIDRRIVGGIPYRTRMLIEGQSGAGESTFSQQFLWGALAAGEDAALYTTEQTVHSFL